MSASSPEAVNQAIEEGWRELRATLTHARTALDRVRATPTTTPEERRELQQQALSGDLGRDMQTLARHVEAGETSWPEVFEGISPYTDLLREHVDRMALLHGEELRRAIEADPSFDPTAGHEDV